MHAGASARVGALGADVGVWLPTFTRRIERTEGSADASWGAAALTARFYLTKLDSPLSLSLGAGGGFGFVSASGDGASQGYATQRTRGNSVIVLGDVSSSIGLSRRLRVHVGAAGAWALDEVAIVFATRQVATFARPLGIATLGAEVIF